MEVRKTNCVELRWLLGAVGFPESVDPSHCGFI